MNFEAYKKEFTSKALKAGYSEDNLQKCLRYAENLIKNDLPIVYNTSHLSALVGYKKSYIKRAAIYTSYFYRSFEIPKKNGSKRQISEPLPSLKDIQIWILENILYKVEVSKYAKAYVPGVGLKQNAVFHKSQKAVLTIDIVNFFGTIDREKVEKVFRNLGYSNILANLLSKLCCLNDCLPQGAPTSPYLSNIYLRSFDEIVARYCSTRKIRYTRYADDMTFSRDFSTDELYEFIEGRIKNLGLSINKDKTKLMTQNNRQFVTGMVVNDKVQASFASRNKIRQELYYIKKYGLENHMNMIKIKKSNYLSHLIGKINFVLYLNPKDEEFIEYKIFLNNLKLS